MNFTKRCFHFTNPDNVVQTLPSVVVDLRSLNFDDPYNEMRRSVTGLNSGQFIKATGKLSVSAYGEIEQQPEFFFSGAPFAKPEIAKRLLFKFGDQVQTFEVECPDPKILEEYIAVNFTRTIDCIDFERSDFVRHRADPRFISAFYRMELHEEKIPCEPCIFRPMHAVNYLLVNEAAAVILREIGFEDDWLRSVIGIESERDNL